MQKSKQPNKTDLIDRNNGKAKNSFGIDLDLEQFIVDEINANKGKAKFRICKNRPLLIPMTDAEIQLAIEIHQEDFDTLKAKGKLVNKLYQIQALRQINNPHRIIQAGEYGGYLNSVANLNWQDESWIDSNVILRDAAYICENSYLSGDIIVIGCANIGNQCIQNLEHRIIINHNGVYFPENRAFNPYQPPVSNDVIQDAFNQHWIRNQIATHVVPMTMIERGI